MNTGMPMQAARYLIGGISTTFLCWGAVWAFVEILNLHYLVSVNLATLCAYFYSYSINKFFVFGDASNQHVVKGSKFLLLQLTLLATTNLFMYVTVSLLGVNYMIAVIIISVANAIMSFFIMRSAIFR
jgi:putative flippase GtrA